MSSVLGHNHSCLLWWTATHGVNGPGFGESGEEAGGPLRHSYESQTADGQERNSVPGAE